ncbi:glycoside hydrolase family 5 protein [Mucilaginibacter sp. X5P1]|uniref:glycoside hydrolase family 5 protein n=1 Tax=Mucilaginibacter sp. X5P1 TaxID=2723088 RepID=UPI00161C6C2D|nr:glycoside hydrolase family 5 protein [Mucilaginibacter sp. X5P1]MBB6137185.1 aryl-phospho-beta-D-glucosidase BglC (GH1 family) [Mucilaginibacter sp. X5P1]
MKKLFLKVFLLLLAYFQIEQSNAQITSQQAITHLQKGINIGNTLDAPGGETSWGQPLIQSYYFDDYKAAGFTAIRIPVTWERHVDTIAPYTIDPEFIARVEQVVDWGLSRGLYIILNCHHEEFIKKDYSPKNVARFEAIWSQIATHFKNKSDHLLFEILNEPHPLSLANLNDLNRRIFKVIRKSNPTRIIVYAGTEWSSDADLLKADIPKDKYLIANFHCYSPWAWVSGKDNNIPWGTQAEKNEIKVIFDRVHNFFASKGIPVMVNEYGCPVGKSQEWRVLFYKTYVENIRSHGFGSFAWDDGGGFKTYDRTGRKWIGGVQGVITSSSGEQ